GRGRSGLLGVLARIAALGDTGRLAGAAAQIIELRTADGAAADDLDRIDVRRIKREDALYALAEADLADGEGGAEAPVRPRDADAFEILDSGAVAFDHLYADAERVAGAELGDCAALGEAFDLLGLELLDEVHVRVALFSLRAAHQRAVAFGRPHDARQGPAALAVYLPLPWLFAMQRSSHDPPIAALRGSCALPI